MLKIDKRIYAGAINLGKLLCSGAIGGGDDNRMFAAHEMSYKEWVRRILNIITPYGVIDRQEKSCNNCVNNPCKGVVIPGEKFCNHWAFKND